MRERARMRAAAHAASGDALSMRSATATTAETNKSPSATTRSANITSADSKRELLSVSQTLRDPLLLLYQKIRTNKS